MYYILHIQHYDHHRIVNALCHVIYPFTHPQLEGKITNELKALKDSIETMTKVRGSVTIQED